MTWKLPTYLYRMQFYTFISDNLLTKNPCTKLGHDWKWVWQRSWFLSHVYNANFPFLVPPNLEKTFQTFPFSLTVSALFNFPFNTRWTCPERLWEISFLAHCISTCGRRFVLLGLNMKESRRSSILSKYFLVWMTQFICVICSTF